jgi:hypothetical protein
MQSKWEKWLGFPTEEELSRQSQRPIDPLPAQSLSKAEPKSAEAKALERIAEDTATLRRFAVIDAVGPLVLIGIGILLVRWHFSG